MNDCKFNSHFNELNKLNESNAASTSHELPTDGADQTDNAPVDDEDALWSIEDDTLFQPRGLTNHSNGADKSVFVTWNEYYLLNFRFKKSKRKNNIEMTKVRIPLPTLGSTYMRSIHMLDYNTLLLMSDGQVYCFGSIKSLHIISWLNGVRCFARTEGGFSVIRHDDAKRRILLEVYEDLPSLDKSSSTLKHSYDFTCDEQNVFHNDWQQDQYTLQTISVKPEELIFMQKLFGAEATTQQLHLFSIAGHVYVLVPMEQSEEEPKYHVELLCIYASAVNFIRTLPQLNLCLVFLSCGTVDILYVSKLGIKMHELYHTGANWLDYDARSDNGDLYYTDGEQLARLRFIYQSEFDDCKVVKNIKSIPGMLACTWVGHIEQLVCLSENNIFHRISFSLQSSESEKDIGVLNDLTTATIERLRLDAQVLAQYENQPGKLRVDCESEYEKQQLLALARNAKWHMPTMEAKISYYRQLPEFKPNALLLFTARQTQLHCSGIFVVLEVLVHKRVGLLHSRHWQLVVYQDQKTHIHCLPTELLLGRKCYLIIPFRKLTNKCFPEVTFKLVSFVELDKEISAVLLPFPVIQSSETYSSLFCGQLASINMFNEPQVTDILQQQKETKNPKIVQKIKVANASLKQIAKLCNVPFMHEDNYLELYFVNSKLSISGDTNFVLMLESEDSSALFYLKQHLRLNMEKLIDLKEEEELQNAYSNDHSILIQQIMKLQCESEQLYGTLPNEAEEIEGNATMHLESLQKLYEKIRNTTYNF